MSNHSYKVNDDNTLTLPNGDKMKIIDGYACTFAPEKYYKMIDNSPFGETLCPIRFYKKTYCKFEYVLTQLVVPPQTKFHVENANPQNLRAKFRFEKAIVDEQCKIKMSGEPEIINTTFSIHDKHFPYSFGKLVEPILPFYDYNQWLLDKKSDTTCQSGIHAFSSITEAKNYNP
jgi:hypothetical protein